MRQGNGAPDPGAIETLKRLIEVSTSVVALTGAGISTAAGIPDYRSPGGVWTKVEPITYQEFVASEEARLEDWRRRFEMNDRLASCQPTLAHRALAAMTRSGDMSAIVTQNIDDLHRRAGTDPQRLIELHGNATFGRCLDCGKPMELETIREHFRQMNRSPVCPQCSGLVKAAVVSFGQAMPESELARAAEFMGDADLVLAIGTSLVVHPAASLPLIGIDNGARLVIINKQSTPLDGVADLVLNHSIDSVFGVLTG